MYVLKLTLEMHTSKNLLWRVCQGLPFGPWQIGKVGNRVSNFVKIERLGKVVVGIQIIDLLLL